MDFDQILDQAIEMLQRRGRVTYRTLKRQFDLDDETLEDLTFELIEGQRITTDENGAVLVWTGTLEAFKLDIRHRTEGRFHALLIAVRTMLQQESRVTYRELKHIFGLDDVLLERIREELAFKQLARDENGKGLVWTGEPQPMMPPVVDIPNSLGTTDPTTNVSATMPTLASVTKPTMPSKGPTEPADTISTDVSQDEPASTTEQAHSAPEAEHRHLTVMFCDLADSTRLSQQLDPEDLREVIRAYQATAAGVMQQYEGHIAQYLGDGLLVYFGYPVAHEDDAQRSLHAGLGIVEVITTTLNPSLEREKGVQLAMRLGIHTGPVVVGQMGSDGRQESLATGETVNIAARLEGLAEPNTVVISSVTERLVRGSFVLEDLGPQELKGVTEPMAVFRVLSPAEVRRDEDESLPDGGMFLVGRDEEIGLLLRRWEQAKEGLGQVVLISGEAGIGKSSLTSTVRHHVAQEEAIRITFRCSPYHTNSALYPVITHLEQMLGFDRDDSSGTKLDKLEQVLRTTSFPVEESVPLLATLLSVPLEDRYASLTISPQQQRQQTLDTLVAWRMEESEKRPVLAVWEDMHWGDPSTLEMLGLVLAQSPTVPMLNVLTFRPEFSPPWPTRSHMTPMTLNRLERPQVEALITHMADDKPLPAEVIEHIVVKTDGVPLYVEELTKMLMASDLMQEKTDQYVLTGPLSTVAIPDTLQNSLMARLDQMNTAKEVAQLGAVLEKSVEVLSLTQAVAHPFTIVFTLVFVGQLHLLRRESDLVSEKAELIFSLVTQHGFPMWGATGKIFKGLSLITLNEIEEGMVLFREGIDSYQATGAQSPVPFYLGILAESYTKLGQPDLGLDVFIEALNLSNKTTAGWYEAELHRIKGELSRAVSKGRQNEAEDCFHKALEVARSQEAKSWELRAATSLARLWQFQGKRQEAYDLLAPVYGWFTEGFDTTDLIDAKTLLDELTEVSC